MEPPTSLQDRAAAGVVWSAIHTWGTHALQLGAVLVLARLLEPQEFGLFAMAQVALVLVQAVADQGIPEALVQSNSSEPEVWSTGFLAVLASSAAGAALLLLAAGPLAALFRVPALGAVIVALAPVVVLYGVHTIFYARIRAGLRFRSHARAGLTGALASLVVGVGMALAGYGVWALVAGVYAGLSVETVGLIRATGWIRFRGFDMAAYRELLRFGRFIAAGALTTVVNRKSDDYFVGLFLGAELLGYYSAAYRLLELVTTVSLRAVERVAFPLFSKIRHSPELMAQALHTSFRFTSLVAFPAFIGLTLVADELVLLALGDRWLPAALPLQILALGGLALCATNVLPSAIRAAGYPQWNVIISAIKGGLLAAAFAVTARLGLEAVAWTFTFGTFAAFPLFFLRLRTVVPLSVGAYLAEGAPALLATLVMVLGLTLAAPLLENLGALPRTALIVGGGALLYLGVALLVAPEQIRELRSRLARLRTGGDEAYE